MNNAETLKVTTPSDREIAMTRVFDAPRALVYEAMTKPDLIKRWLLGPPGWTMPVCEIDLRVGGAYRYVWHGPKGEVMGMRGVFLEIAPPERSVASELFDDPWYSGEAIVTTVLTEHGGKTTLTTTIRYESQKVRDSVLKSHTTAGVGMSYDRLAEVLGSIAAETLSKEAG